MSKLNTMEKIVLKILEDFPDTRKDDYILYYFVCRYNNTTVLTKTLGTALLNHNELKLPSWETVTRCRRKIQEKRPDLVAPDTARKRHKEEETYREYAKTS